MAPVTCTMWSGTVWDLLEPRAEDVWVTDIAHHLSLVCRWGGAVKYHFSVAQHACLVHDLVLFLDRGLGDPVLRAQALHHDDSEAFLGDVRGQLKRTLVFERYRTLERDTEDVICEALGIPSGKPEPVALADKVINELERFRLIPQRCSITEPLDDETHLAAMVRQSADAFDRIAAYRRVGHDGDTPSDARLRLGKAVSDLHALVAPDDTGDNAYRLEGYVLGLDTSPWSPIRARREFAERHIRLMELRRFLARTSPTGDTST